jgi:phosphatidate cytidylyltransferase
MRLRALSAIVLAVPALAAVYLGWPIFDLAIAVVALVMAFEWDRLCSVGVGGQPAQRRDLASWTLVLGVTVIVALALCGLHSAAVWAVPAGFAALYAVTSGLDRKRPLLTASGALYIGLPVVALLWLRHDSVHGMTTVFWLLAVVWAADTAALLVGKAVGGPKLAPAISPNKTWAGFIGGLVAALLVSLIAGLWQGPEALWPVVLVGGLLAVVAQAGDLLESRIKRHLQVKDSGATIPGHGGFFDRVDGLLAAAPALAVIYLAAGGGRFLWQ